MGTLKANRGQALAERCESKGVRSISELELSLLNHEVIKNTMLNFVWVSGSFPNASVIYDSKAKKNKTKKTQLCLPAKILSF